MYRFTQKIGGALIVAAVKLLAANVVLVMAHVDGSRGTNQSTITVPKCREGKCSNRES